jgi:hypothetical protein
MNRTFGLVSVAAVSATNDAGAKKTAEITKKCPADFQVKGIMRAFGV